MGIRVSRKSGAIGAAIAAAALTVGAALPAQATTSGWRGAFSAHYGVAINYSVYDAVVATAGNNAWALGGADDSGGNGTASQVEGAHWTGSTWHTVSMPKGVGSFIDAASAPAGNDIWAVTRMGGQVLHYNGTSFSVAHTFPAGPQQLTGVLAFSPANVWTFGAGGSGPGYGTYHYNGSTWTAQTGAAQGILTASAVSASDIWAVGSDGNAPDNTIVQYNGKSWTRVTYHSLADLTFRGIAAVNSKSVWIVATLGGTSTATPYLLHYNGGGVSKAQIPWAILPSAVASDGQGGAWMLGSDSSNVSYAIHVTPKGVWSRVQLSGGALTLGSVPGTTAMWAAGSTQATSGSNAGIWAYGRP